MIPFEKFHGTGNDFVAIDATAAEAIDDRGAFARAVCDRTTGIGAGQDQLRTGADGVLFLDAQSTVEPARVRMELYQPDGGTAAMCGNGARCVAAWMTRRHDVTDLVIDAPAGDRPATVHLAEGQPTAATIEMGPPTFDPDAVPVDADEPVIEQPVADVAVTVVSTGVAHAVVFVSDVGAVPLDRMAPPVRSAALFPAGTNVTVAARTDPDRGDGLPVFAQRTYERGVEGETQACGTGAVAILAAARRLGHTAAETAVVRPPGGELQVTVPETGSATLRGPVTATLAGSLPADPAGVGDATIEVLES